MTNQRPLYIDVDRAAKVPTTDTLNVSGLNAPSTPLTLDGAGRRVDAGVLHPPARRRTSSSNSTSSELRQAVGAVLIARKLLRR
jgi:hypothetical protein